ncbi:MAG: hypothetical protein EHM41_00175 [Chloroflexi bacterium]|nr:MAG: hypothetical protein EHM41_00175 [Chloroflexota bacterium]
MTEKVRAVRFIRGALGIPDEFKIVPGSMFAADLTVETVLNNPMCAATREVLVFHQVPERAWIYGALFCAEFD